HTNQDAVLALMDTKNFLERDEADQQKVMLRLTRPPTIEVPEAARAVGVAELTSTQDIDALIKRIKDVTIRGLNREVEDLEEAIRNAPAEVPDVVAVRAELVRVQALHQSNIQAQTLRQEYERKLEGAKEEVVRLSLEAAYGGRPLASILEDLDALEKETAGNAAKLKEAEDSWKTATAEKEAKLSEAKALRAAAEKEYEAARQLAAETGSQADMVTAMGSSCIPFRQFECPLTPRDKKRMGVMLCDQSKAEAKRAEGMRKNSEVIDGRIKAIEEEVKEKRTATEK